MGFAQRLPLSESDGDAARLGRNLHEREAFVERRLAAILAADAVGYSRMMREDEPGALALLHKHRSEVIDPGIAKGSLRNYRGT